MNDMMNIDWNEIFQDCKDDVRAQWTTFAEIFRTAEQECIPQKL